MDEKYDCTKDVLRHKEIVEYWMRDFATRIRMRSEIHDDSKLNDPIEKAMFDQWTPELQKREFGTPEYKEALEGMGEGLKRHYATNRHHPEHYKNGINEMTLADIVEMVCDWMAAAQRKKTAINLNECARRWGLSEQLITIIANTLREQDVWNEIEGIPAPYFLPSQFQNGYVEGFEKVKKD